MAMADIKKQQPTLKNVAVFEEDHRLLKEMADFQERSMTRQLGIILRNYYETHMQTDKV
jgi:hypothetical protein